MKEHIIQKCETCKKVDVCKHKGELDNITAEINKTYNKLTNPIRTYAVCAFFELENSGHWFNNRKTNN